MKLLTAALTVIVAILMLTLFAGPAHAAPQDLDETPEYIELRAFVTGELLDATFEPVGPARASYLRTQFESLTVAVEDKSLSIYIEAASFYSKSIESEYASERAKLKSDLAQSTKQAKGRYSRSIARIKSTQKRLLRKAQIKMSKQQLRQYKRKLKQSKLSAFKQLAVSRSSEISQAGSAFKSQSQAIDNRIRGELNRVLTNIEISNNGRLSQIVIWGEDLLFQIEEQ